MPMPLELMDRNQRALYWGVTGRDEYNNVVLGGPTELLVRWCSLSDEEKAADKSLVDLDSQVILDRRVDYGGQMWLAPDWTYSALEQWYATGSAGKTNEIMTIASYREIPDIKARHVMKVAGLRKQSSDNP